MRKYYCDVVGNFLSGGARCLYERGQIDPTNDRTCRECEHYALISLRNQKPLSMESPGEDAVDKTKPTATKKMATKSITQEWGNKKMLECFRRCSGEYDLSKFVSTDRDPTEKIHDVLPDISLILSLHPTFWENPQFLRWQLIRLNPFYIEQFNKQMEIFLPWIHEEWIREEMASSVQKVLYENPTVLMEKIKQGDYSDKICKSLCYLIFTEAFLLLSGIDPNKQESFEDWCSRVSVFEDKVMKLVTTNYHFYKILRMLPIPIPPRVRFPMPFLQLLLLPPWPTGKRGRISNWSRNLLVYELSQSGMTDTHIAILLFGREVDHSYRGKNDKDEIFSKIAGYRETVKNSIDRSFPFT